MSKRKRLDRLEGLEAADDLPVDEEPADEAIVEMMLAVAVTRGAKFRVMLVEQEGAEVHEHTLGFVDKVKALQEVFRAVPRLQRFLATGKLPPRKALV